VREEEESGAGTAPKKKKSSLGSLLGKRTATTATLTPNQKATAEITLYLQEMAVDGKENPLTGWKNNKGRLAHKY
jgi:TRAP-type C4-dicarboxylate transport system substrate-binding protein